MEEKALVTKLHAEVVEELQNSVEVLNNITIDFLAWKIIHHALDYHSAACHVVVKDIKKCTCATFVSP